MKYNSLILLGLLGALLTTTACSRNYTKPRSVVLEEAASQGIQLPSPEEERALFDAKDRENNQRLISLLTKRASRSAADSNYKIGINDEIEINVFDVPELNLTTKVRDSGFISLPLIGAVEARGKTEGELQEIVTKRLSSFVKSPEVAIFLTNYGSQHVAVIGAVSKPGSLALKKGSNSMLDLISEAGGLTNRAGNYVSFIPAEISGMTAQSDTEARARLSLASYDTNRYNESGIEIPIDKILGTRGGIPLEIPVRGGDMVIIPEAGLVTVDGEVNQRGSFELGQRMTLLGALAAAKGINYSAKVDEVEVIRDIGGERRARLIVNLEHISRGEEPDIRLRDGDIVVVPSEYGRKLRQDTFETITGIINFGVGGQYNVAN